MQRRETLLGSHVRGGLSRPVREDHVPVGIVLPKDPAQPVTRANAGIVLGSLRNRVPGVARLGRWAGRITMNAHDDRKKLLNEFLKNGDEYFRQMRIDNTARMVSGLQTKVEALDATIQQASRSSGKVARAMLWLTVAIAAATIVQAWSAYVQIQRGMQQQPPVQSAPALK